MISTHDTVEMLWMLVHLHAQWLKQPHRWAPKQLECDMLDRMVEIRRLAQRLEAVSDDKRF